MKAKYVVTARNRMTGEREAISLPCGKEKAEELRLKFTVQQKRPRAYTYPKVEPWQRDLFKQ